MKQYNFTEARQNLAFVLDTAKKEGVICISRRDGDSFYIMPVKPNSSPLSIEGVDLGLSGDDLVDLVRESREKSYF
jgi:prevent-host-death family protein